MQHNRLSFALSERIKLKPFSAEQKKTVKRSLLKLYKRLIVIMSFPFQNLCDSHFFDTRDLKSSLFLVTRLFLYPNISLELLNVIILVV